MMRSDNSWYWEVAVPHDDADGDDYWLLLLHPQRKEQQNQIGVGYRPRKLFSLSLPDSVSATCSGFFE